MDLILTVIADPQGANMRNHTKVFDQGGGSFGRAEDNTWVLPDPERVVSSRHAKVEFDAGKFYVVDSSTNGTFLNDAPAAIQKGTKQPLADGDVLGVGDYRLKVSMRIPERKPDLPKGLAPVDFFDESDKTRMSEANLDNMQSGAADFDHLLDPNKTPAAQDDQWGFVSEQSIVKPAADNSLLSGLPSVSGETSASELDPLAHLGGGDKSEIAWDNDEDWWKSGSEADNAPADRHALDFVSPASQAPAEQPPPPIPTPVEAKVEPPTAEFESQTAPESNPFEASAALLQDQVQDDCSEILSSADGAASGEQAAPAPIPPAAEPPRAQRPPAPPAEAPQAVKPAVAPAPAPTQMPGAPATAHSMQSLAESLGLNNLDEEQLEQLIPEAAEIIQESIARLIDLMRARTSIKNELRVAQTMIQLKDNNPLKFSVTARDAITTMFAHTNPAFMSPKEAVKDSFDDLTDHQMAVLSGMRAAYEYMLEQFSPKTLEQKLNVKSGHVILSKNAKKWEAYEKLFDGMKRDAEGTYRRLFGEEFANAYELQLAELKNARGMK